jgi:APA family basic amino acid/polyamine antiporter
MSRPPTSELPRTLNLLDASAIVVGTTIGGAIFVIPSPIARELGSAPLIFAVWLTAGLISFVGALAYAELGAMLPHSGGQYVYIREAYGRLAAFLAGWSFFLVIQSGAIAAVSTVFALYLSYLFPSVPHLAAVAPPLLIALLTAINYAGVKLGARVQVALTLLKLAGLGALVVSSFLVPSHLLWAVPRAPSIGSVGLAMLGAFLAFDGWHVIAFVAGEVSHPRRNVPLALALGVTAAGTVYLLANLAYLRALPIAQIAASERVAADSALVTLGPLGAVFVSATIMLSTAGAANGVILTSPRIYFAQARDKLFFSRFGEIHPKYRTPSFSITIQGVWTALLALSGSYEALVTYVLFVTFVIHAASVLGVIVLRRRHPDWARPYKMWGYPASPLLFAAFAICFVGNTLIERPVPSLFGTLIVLSGIPMYVIWRKKT